MRNWKKLVTTMLVLALILTSFPVSSKSVDAAVATKETKKEQQAGKKAVKDNKLFNDFEYDGEGEEVLEPSQDFLQNVIDEANELGIPNAFIRHNFIDSYVNEELAEPEVALVEGETNPGVAYEAVTSTEDVEGLQVLDVDTGVLARTKFDLGEFDFGDYKVGNLIYNMSAKKNLKGVAELYFEDAVDPFTTITIKRVADEWGATKNLAADVRKSGLTGKGHIYLKFIADSAYGEDGGLLDVSGVKGDLYFESMFFTEGSTPIIDFDLDKEVSTIEEINNSELHTLTGYGNMNVKIPDGYVSEYTKDTLKDATYELDYIRGRGNSTWLVDKKPYKVKLAKKADLFGMGKSKHWVLLANYYDYSLMRNKLTNKLAEEMGLEYTPKSISVDVVISGEYYGSYQLSQQVRIEKSSVNIDDLEDDPVTTGAAITGGYLISMGTSWATESEEDVTWLDEYQNFRLEKPEYEDDYPEEAKEAQLAYMRNYIGELNTVVNNMLPEPEEDEDYEGNVEEETVIDEDDEYVDDEDGDGEEESEFPSEFYPPEGATWRDYLDEDSLIKYYIMQEISKNGDAYSGSSTYLYKKRNGKLYFGPVWDFDFVAWGAYATNFNDMQSVETFSMIDSCPWFSTLIKYDPEFKANFIKEWKKISEILKSVASDGGYIDEYANSNYFSALANYQIRGSYLMQTTSYWGEEMGELVDDEGNPYTLNYYNEINRLKAFIIKATEWCDENVENIDTFEGEEETDFPNVPLYVDDELVAEIPFDPYIGLDTDLFPEDPVKEGYKFIGWYYKDSDGEEHKLVPESYPFTEVPSEEDPDIIDHYEPYKGYAKFVPLSEFKDIEKLDFAVDTIYFPLTRSEDEEDWGDWGDILYAGKKAGEDADGGEDAVDVDGEGGDDENIDEGDGEEEEYISYEMTSELNLLRFLNVYPFDTDVDLKYDLKWECDDESVDVVNGDVMVSEIGEFNFTCSYNDLSAKIKVITYDSTDEDMEEYYGPNGITVDENVEIKPGEFGSVNFKFDTDNENISCLYYDKVYFNSFDEEIAAVNQNGVILAKKAGETQIITMFIDENNKVIVKKTNVIVKSADVTPSEDPTPSADVPTNSAVDPTPTAVTVKKPAKVVVKKLTKKKKKDKKLVVKIKKPTKVSGYQIAIYKTKKNAKKNKKVLVKKIYKKASFTVKNKKLKNKKKLFVKVRAFNLDGKKKVYGAWSKVNTVKAK
ncbi:MAG: CotH kinase family protein [Lachnospiraceae bacterium]|nr:CotH kinase family protein [Lachnospiraceae bacterium]